MKYNDLLKTIQSPYFSRRDHLLDGQKLFDYQISLWVKKGNLLRLKNGMYAFTPYFAHNFLCGCVIIQTPDYPDLIPRFCGGACVKHAGCTFRACR